MNSKYIHIGFPKNFSTSLQRSYFSTHPELFHLGIGLDNDNLGYIDSSIEKALEVYLKSCKDFKYQEAKPQLQKAFEDYFRQAKQEGKKVGISAEHLSFSFSYDSISSKNKAERLYDIFGEDTSIILIIRNQFQLIKSLFRESIRVGYAGDFSEYLYLFYKYQDRNYYYDIAYSHMYKTYVNLFGKENVHVLFFENYRDSENNLMVNEDRSYKLITDLNEALGLTQLIDFQHFNKALSLTELEAKRKLNAKKAHDLSNHLLETAEKHRIKKYLKDDLALIEAESKTYEDVASKRELISKAAEMATEERINYQSDPEILKKIMAFYHADNRVVESLLETYLPNQYYSPWE